MKNTLHINSPSLFSSVVKQQSADSGDRVVGVTYDCIDGRSVFLLMLQYFSNSYSNQYLDKGKVFCNSSLLPLTNHMGARSTVQRLTCYQSWGGGQTSSKNEAHDNIQRSFSNNRKQTVELSTKCSIKHNTFSTQYWLFVNRNKHFLFKHS